MQRIATEQKKPSIDRLAELLRKYQCAGDHMGASAAHAYTRTPAATPPRVGELTNAQLAQMLGGSEPEHNHSGSFDQLEQALAELAGDIYPRTGRAAQLPVGGAEAALHAGPRASKLAQVHAERSRLQAQLHQVDTQLQQLGQRRAQLQQQLAQLQQQLAQLPRSDELSPHAGDGFAQS